MLRHWKNGDGNREHQAEQKKPDTKSLYYMMSLYDDISLKLWERQISGCGESVGWTLGNSTKVNFCGDISILYLDWGNDYIGICLYV